MTRRQVFKGSVAIAVLLCGSSVAVAQQRDHIIGLLCDGVVEYDHTDAFVAGQPLEPFELIIHYRDSQYEGVAGVGYATGMHGVYEKVWVRPDEIAFGQVHEDAAIPRYNGYEIFGVISRFTGNGTLRWQDRSTLEYAWEYVIHCSVLEPKF